MAVKEFAARAGERRRTKHFAKGAKSISTHGKYADALDHILAPASW
jgi:hypothetical protein